MEGAGTKVLMETMEAENSHVRSILITTEEANVGERQLRCFPVFPSYTLEQQELKRFSSSLIFKAFVKDLEGEIAETGEAPRLGGPLPRNIGGKGEQQQRKQMEYLQGTDVARLGWGTDLLSKKDRGHHIPF